MRLIMMVLMSFIMLACEPRQKTAKEVQAEKAQAQADSIKFTENAEIENIKKRLELTSNPGLTGFIILLNEMGQPVMYTSVKGKVTSGSKRLTAPDHYTCDGGVCNYRPAPSDEGTYGSSDSYIYFWTMSGQYIQWNGKYLYSEKPFRLDTKPLVVDINLKNVIDQHK